MASSLVQSLQNLLASLIPEPEPEQERNTEWDHLDVPAKPVKAKLPAMKEIPIAGFLNHQVQSPLFQLPLELRQLIYREILGGEMVHITRIDGRLNHVKCRSSPSDRAAGIHRCWGRVFRDSGDFVEPHPDFPSEDGEILQLLLTCRRVYLEAIPILYTANTFHTNQLCKIIRFSASIPMSSYRSIRSFELFWGLVGPYTHFRTQYNRRNPGDSVGRVISIQVLDPVSVVQTWQHVCRLIAGMDGLEHLVITMSRCGPPVEPEGQSMLKHSIIRPLFLIQRPRFFIINVNWDIGQLDCKPKPPFTVTRYGP